MPFLAPPEISFPLKTPFSGTSLLLTFLLLCLGYFTARLFKAYPGQTRSPVGILLETGAPREGIPTDIWQRSGIRCLSPIRHSAHFLPPSGGEQSSQE